MSTVSAARCVSTTDRRDEGRTAARGATLALQPTRLLQRADEADITDRQDDERNEQC